MTTTHYDRVGVSLTASTSEIKRAYRKRARHAHPDQGGSATQFRLLADAYEVLIDAHRRATYDAELERSFRAPGTPRTEQQERRAPRQDGAPPRKGSSSSRSSGARPSSPDVQLPPRVVLDEPRLPEQRPRAVRRAEAFCWVAAALLLAYVVGAYAIAVSGPSAAGYGAFAFLAGVPAFVGLGASRRASVRGPRPSIGGWQVVGLLISAGLTSSYVQLARSGEASGVEPRVLWAFAISTGVVPMLLITAGMVLYRVRANALREVVADHVHWAKTTERRIRAEDWAAMDADARRPGHGLWWVLEATREGAYTRVDVVDKDRTNARTGRVLGPCFAHIWIVIDEQTDSVVRRSSDDRRQAWVDELAAASA